MDDLISRQAAIDAVTDELDTIDHVPQWVFDRLEKRLKQLPPAQPEITHEQAVEYLQSTGWMQNHDLQMMLDGVHRFTAQPEPCEDTVKSHSEKDVLDMCISLLDEMVGYFSEYMEWIGYEPTEEEKECGYFGMTYFHIVQKLFLYHTTHSGGTSTFKKCHELGIDDPSDGVRFPLWKEEEGDAE